MKTLFLTLLVLISTFSAQGGEAEQNVSELLEKIRAEIPKDWTASYDKKDSWLEVSRDKPVTG